MPRSELCSAAGVPRSSRSTRTLYGMNSQGEVGHGKTEVLGPTCPVASENEELCFGIPSTRTFSRVFQ